MHSTSRDNTYPTLSRHPRKTTTLTSLGKIGTTSKWFFRLPVSYYIGMKLLHYLMDDKKLLADQFNEFFMMKIDKIMDSLVPSDTHPINEKYIEKGFLTSLCLTNFRPITLQELLILANLLHQSLVNWIPYRQVLF